MFDWLRELTKSAEIRQQERITAYVDDQLTTAERQQFEAAIRDDAALRAEVEALQRLKAGLRAMPRTTAPRNFLLDPAEFRQPAPARDVQAYPLLRGATVMAGLMFMLLLVFSALTNGANQPMAFDDASDTAALIIEEAEVVEQMAEAESPVEEAMAEEVVMEEEAAPESTSIIVATTAALIIEEPEAIEQAAEAEPLAEEAMAEEAAPEPTPIAVATATATAIPMLTELAEESMDEGAMMGDSAAPEPTSTHTEAAPYVVGEAASDDTTEESMDEQVEADMIAPRNVEATPLAVETVLPTPTVGPTLAVVQLPTETAPVARFVEETPTFVVEIQPPETIAEHSSIGAEETELPLTSDAPARQTSPAQRWLIAVGVLFLLLLLLTLLLRQRINRVPE